MLHRILKDYDLKKRFQSALIWEQVHALHKKTNS